MTLDFHSAVISRSWDQASRRAQHMSAWDFLSAPPPARSQKNLIYFKEKEHGQSERDKQTLC